jgi:high-affinity iron transporter
MVSELFNGLGIEILESIELFLIFFCLLFSSSYMFTRRQLTSLEINLMMTGIILFFITNSTQFIIFIDSYMANSDAIKNITIGLIIGLGICLSFSALLYFAMTFLTAKKYFSLAYFIWAFFLTGHVSQVIHLLQQVDFITDSESIWDSTSIVKDSSEYGHLLKTLFGYEASPSFEFIVLYVFSLILFLVYFLKQTSNKRQCIVDNAKENKNVL